MQAVEILKGSSQIQYGPFTTGGAINLVSTAIPDEFSEILEQAWVVFNTQQTHFKIGATKSKLGFVVEYLKNNSDGFKNLINDKNTGFNKNDVVAKLNLKAITIQNINNHFYSSFNIQTSFK